MAENGGKNQRDLSDSLIYRLKMRIKKSPRLFSFVYHIVGSSFLGVSAVKALKDVPLGSVVLNLGSGVTKVRSDVVNIDMYAYENVDIVADIANLPFENDSVDAVICEHVLEHVKDVEKVVSEIRRVLKPGGIIYAVTPFVMSFHSSPYDYRRFSEMGLEELFKDFERIDSGMRSGPGAALDYILAEYFGTILSFGSRHLQQVLSIGFLVLFAPLCWLDYLVRFFPTAQKIAHAVYYIGKKPR